MDRVRSKLPSFRKGLGPLGESWAKTYLEGRGYRILAMNFHCVLGEIDLVAEEGGELVFVEVKTRSGISFGYPEEQLSSSKKRRLVKLAQWYLKHCEKRERAARFDIVSILAKEGKIAEVDLITNAFTP